MKHFTLNVYTCFSRDLGPITVGINVFHSTFILSVILTLDITDVQDGAGRTVIK